MVYNMTHGLKFHTWFTYLILTVFPGVYPVFFIVVTLQCIVLFIVVTLQCIVLFIVVTLQCIVLFIVVTLQCIVLFIVLALYWFCL
jgi:hypothetical protein